MDAFDLSRRQVLKGSAAAMAVGAMGSLSALYSRQALAAGDPTRLAPIPGRYGPLAAVADRATGLPLLQLPRGFSYRSFGWSGDRMSDGQPCPDRHDGMAVVGLRKPGRGPRDNGRGHGNGHELVLIRNHERGGADPDQRTGRLRQRRHRRRPACRRRHHHPHLPQRRMAQHRSQSRRNTGQLRRRSDAMGYLADLRGDQDRRGLQHRPQARLRVRGASRGRTHQRPSAGRTGTLQPRSGGDRSAHRHRLSHRGRPQQVRPVPLRSQRSRRTLRLARDTAADCRPRACVASPTPISPSPRSATSTRWNGSTFPMPTSTASPRRPASRTSPPAKPSAALSRRRWSAGALRMSRGEGIWHSYGKMFIVDTSTGVDDQGRKGRGNGAVWVLDLLTQRMRALFVSGNQLAAHNPDNITVSPRGGVLLCEDGGESPDQYGPGARLIGLTRERRIFLLLQEQHRADVDADRQRRQDHRRRRLPRKRVLRRVLGSLRARRCSSTSRRRASRSPSPGRGNAGICKASASPRNAGTAPRGAVSCFQLR